MVVEEKLKLTVRVGTIHVVLISRYIEALLWTRG